MAPPAYATDFHLGNGPTRRAGDETCSGWNCLSDATQTGIILVVICSVAVLGYIYWRFKIKPNQQHGGNHGRSSTNGYWEVTRSSPNRVSITIYREPRPPNDQEAGKADNRGAVRVRGNKENNKSTQTEENVFNPTTPQAGDACVPQIHLLPPPPPPVPVFWTAAAPSTVPPPPPSGHSVPWPSGPPPVPLYPIPVGPGLVTTSYPPDVPPPYFNHSASHNFERYDPKQGIEATARSAWTPQPARWSSPPRTNQERMHRATPPARNQSQWRRWFSWGGRPRMPGHARTLSDSSSTITRSRSPSSPPHPAFPRPHGRGQRSPHHGYGPSYINPSVEAVCNSSELAGPHHRVNRQPSRERPSCRDRGQATRPVPSDSASLSPLPRQRSLSPRPSRREPSPEIQSPTPERRRARVSFERAGDSDRSSTPSPRDSGARRHSATWYARRNGREDISRRRSQLRREREPAPLLFEVFRLIRHALRGDY
ncbi:hypothetical protein C8A03DRAFT_13648 [Achaetomium macrosporum]|uniref:Uncharacterized protein n=1 Tax=Achaetomium macrosporum TaxID=79813 RepID=A0AAN7HCQ4_9PEZI|nr:hypothetical protein C8A03DRAFT_13648 [Achaetomium macrosporum]